MITSWQLHWRAMAKYSLHTEAELFSSYCLLVLDDINKEVTNTGIYIGVRRTVAFDLFLTYFWQLFDRFCLVGPIQIYNVWSGVSCGWQLINVNSAPALILDFDWYNQTSNFEPVSATAVEFMQRSAEFEWGTNTESVSSFDWFKISCRSYTWSE